MWADSREWYQIIDANNVLKHKVFILKWTFLNNPYVSTNRIFCLLILINDNDDVIMMMMMMIKIMKMVWLS